MQPFPIVRAALVFTVPSSNGPEEAVLAPAEHDAYTSMSYMKAPRRCADIISNLFLRLSGVALLLRRQNLFT